LLGAAAGAAGEVAEGAAIGVAGGVAMGVVEAEAIGVAEGVAIGVAGGVDIGIAERVTIAVAGGVVAGAAPIAAAGGVAAGGTENNSKSLMKMGIDGTGDPVACGIAKLRGIPKAEDRTIKRKIRIAQVNFPCRTGEKNMRGSLGRVSLYDTRRDGRKRRKSVASS